MKKISFKIEGTQPLMLNNSQVVNPFNKYTIALKPLTSLKKKPDEIMTKIYQLQFESSLYIKNGVYIIPCDHFWRSVINASKEQKLGKKFERSFQIMEDCVLEFPEKNMTPAELFKEGSHVDIRDCVLQGRSRVPACRAIFTEWSTKVEAWYDENQLNESDIVNMFEIAGLRYHVGTYRARFGAFNATKIQ